METVFDQALEEWVLKQSEVANHKLYFTINGDVPLVNAEGQAVYYLVPVRGKLVCVLHPDHLTRVAQICYAAGIQMVQVII
ncbi:MAG TPA: hypothetical protein VF806_07635 [Anaerolineaceae bacterium]